MTPPVIVAAALRKGLAMIALCDHNSCGNAAAVQEAAGRELAVIAGIEITTAEEVHVLGLFPGVEQAQRVSKVVSAGLPEWRTAPGPFGGQWLMDAEGKVTGEETKMLSVASSLTLSEAVQLIKRQGGLAVASHVDRPSFSVLSQLGMFPPDAEFDAVEISAAGQKAGRRAEFASLGFTVISSSDSHFPEEIGSSFTILEMQAPRFGELSLALKGAGGRRVCDA